MTLKDWNKLTAKEQEEVASWNLSKSTSIYPEKDVELPVPENTHCLVYFKNNGIYQGWLKINKTSDMGLEALIASDWIALKDVEDIAF